MVDRSEQGKRARTDFIAAEKELRLRRVSVLKLPTYPEALRQLSAHNPVATAGHPMSIVRVRFDLDENGYSEGMTCENVGAVQNLTILEPNFEIVPHNHRHRSMRCRVQPNSARPPNKGGANWFHIRHVSALCG